MILLMLIMIIGLLKILNRVKCDIGSVCFSGSNTLYIDITTLQIAIGSY